MPDDIPDFRSLYSAEDPTYEEKARALTAALRGRSQLGSILALTGDRAVAPLGASYMQEAARGQERLADMPMARARLTGMEQQNASGQAEAEAAQARRSAMVKTAPAFRGALQKMGVAVPETLSDEDLAAAWPDLADVGNKLEANETKRTVAKMRADTLTAAAADRQERQRAAQEAKESSALDKRFTLFGQELDPTKARGGEMAKVLNRRVQADAALKLVEGKPNPTDTEMYELARSFDRLVSGGAATVGATSHLVPQTALGSLASFAQWLTNEPIGQNKQAFVKRMVDSINREKDFATNQIRDWQGKKAARFSDLHGKDAARFAAELQNWDLAPEHFDQKTWRYHGPPAAADPALAHYKSKLQPGERLARTADGKYVALGQNEKAPAGYVEIP